MPPFTSSTEAVERTGGSSSWAVPDAITLAKDFAAAFIASTALSIPVTIIDKAVVENATGANTLGASMRTALVKLLMTPHKFLTAREYFVVHGVYTATYLAANWTDSVCEASSRSNKIPKLASTTLVNLGAAASKDRIFGIWFSGKPPAPFPLVSWSLFFVRDLGTMATAFSLPPAISQSMVERDYSQSTAKYVSQIAPVMAIQWLTVPLHLIAYDLYVHKLGSGRTAADRLAFLRQKYTETVGARSMRIFPAFGLGGLGNTWLRNALLGKPQE